MSANTFKESIEETIQLGTDFRNYSILKDFNNEINLFIPKLDDLSLEIGKCLVDYDRLLNVQTETDISFDALNAILEQMKDEITKNSFSNFTYQIAKERVGKIKSNLQRIWSDYVYKEISSTESILKMTKNLMNNDLRNKFDNLLKEIKLDSIATDRQVDALRKYKITGQDYINSIDLSDPVVKFLESISIRGYITVNELNDTVILWLEQNGFSNRFIVKMIN